MSLRLLVLVVLAAALFASSVAQVYVQHLRRVSFVELRELEGERDAMDIEWGQLQLEQSTWATHDRIERLARERLRLRVPMADTIVLVGP